MYLPRIQMVLSVSTAQLLCISITMVRISVLDAPMVHSTRTENASSSQSYPISLPWTKPMWFNPAPTTLWMPSRKISTTYKAMVHNTNSAHKPLPTLTPHLNCALAALLMPIWPSCMPGASSAQTTSRQTEHVLLKLTIPPHLLLYLKKTKPPPKTKLPLLLPTTLTSQILTGLLMTMIQKRLLITPGKWPKWMDPLPVLLANSFTMGTLRSAKHALMASISIMTTSSVRIAARRSSILTFTLALSRLLLTSIKRT